MEEKKTGAKRSSVLLFVKDFRLEPCGAIPLRALAHTNRDPSHNRTAAPENISTSSFCSSSFHIIHHIAQHAPKEKSTRRCR